MADLVLSLVFLSLCVVVCPSVGAPVGTRCAKIPGAPSCVCKTPKGKVVDLTKIASYDGTPRFTGFASPRGMLYDYNPCFAFSEGGDCTNAQICEIQRHVIGDKTKIADNGTEQIWINGEGEPYVYYTGPADREIFVELRCDPAAVDPVVTTVGDREKLFHIYNITVRSTHFCSPYEFPFKCEATGGSPSCVCNTAKGTIDLTKIALFDGTPRFVSVPHPDANIVYDYNPCAAFTSGCPNVNGCERYPKAESLPSNSIADFGSEKMLISEQGDVYLNYSTGADYYYRNSH